MRPALLCLFLLSACGMPWTQSTTLQPLRDPVRLTEDAPVGSLTAHATLDRERGTGDVLATRLRVDFTFWQYEGSCLSEDCEPVLLLRIGDDPEVAIPMPPGSTQTHGIEVTDILLDCRRPDTCTHSIPVAFELMDGGVVDVNVGGNILVEGDSGAKRDATTVRLQATTRGSSG